MSNANTSTYAANMIYREMNRWGISKARLVRRAKASQVTAKRVSEAMKGIPAAGASCWNEAMIQDWLEMVRTSFTY
jgi:hypothetical protein